MNRAAPAALLAAATLALTACEHTPDEVTAQVACERLVTPDLHDPDAAEFQHITTTQDGDRWTVSGVVTTEDRTEQYRCHVEFHDGANFTGDVYYLDAERGNR